VAARFRLDGTVAVVTGGTCLGAGFPPAPASLAPLAEDFTIRRGSP
jgi:hypothetical protein